jgi:hypothetical protein
MIDFASIAKPYARDPDTNGPCWIVRNLGDTQSEIIVGPISNDMAMIERRFERFKFLQ